MRKSSAEMDDEHDDGKPLKVIVETTNARKAREKAEWERLSLVEKIVKKLFPSQINSIAILVIAARVSPIVHCPCARSWPALAM